MPDASRCRGRDDSWLDGRSLPALSYLLPHGLEATPSGATALPCSRTLWQPPRLLCLTSGVSLPDHSVVTASTDESHHFGRILVFVPRVARQPGSVGLHRSIKRNAPRRYRTGDF